MENFRFLALHYLNDWCAYDSGFVKGLRPEGDRRTRLRKLREVAIYYKVARNFKTIVEDRLDGALKAIDAVKHPITHENVDSTVRDLAENFRSVYGNNLISASSKFLWILHKAPLVIYDARAICTLKSRGEKFGECDYKGYRKAWLAQFEIHEKFILQSCEQLIQVKDSSLAHAMADEELVSLVGNRWFHERVFDKFLWWNGRG